MLVNFKFKNFKSFKEETSFSFEKGQKRELNHHIIHANDKYELLPIKVIYGSNASGKSNLLEALHMLKMFILRKGIRFQQDDYVDLCSNFDNHKNPIEFSITFIIDNREYDYFLSFVNSLKKESKILKETLKEDKKTIFERTNNRIKFSSDKEVINEHYKILLEENSQELIKKMIEGNIKSTDIFTNWYSTIDSKFCEKISLYFSNIITIMNTDQFNINSFIKFDDKNKIYQDKKINKLLKELNVGKEEVFFKYSEDGKINNFVSYKTDDINIIAPLNTIESKGTIKLIDLLYPLFASLQNGTPLFIDELDASIHHEIIYNIIQTFGDPTINTKGAQLIFTTHNPVYLNKNLLRRDEIVFIEKDNSGSHLHTLDDYNIRNDQVYLKNYLNGNYTVLPNFDFNNIMK